MNYLIAITLLSSFSILTTYTLSPSLSSAPLPFLLLPSSPLLNKKDQSHKNLLTIPSPIISSTSLEMTTPTSQENTPRLLYQTPKRSSAPTKESITPNAQLGANTEPPTKRQRTTKGFRIPPLPTPPPTGKRKSFRVPSLPTPPPTRERKKFYVPSFLTEIDGGEGAGAEVAGSKIAAPKTPCPKIFQPKAFKPEPGISKPDIPNPKILKTCAPEPGISKFKTFKSKTFELKTRSRAKFKISSNADSSSPADSSALRRRSGAPSPPSSPSSPSLPSSPCPQSPSPLNQQPSTQATRPSKPLFPRFPDSSFQGTREKNGERTAQKSGKRKGLVKRRETSIDGWREPVARIRSQHG